MVVTTRTMPSFARGWLRRTETLRRLPLVRPRPAPRCVLKRAPAEVAAANRTPTGARWARGGASRAAAVSFAGRHWLLGAAAVAAVLLVTVTGRGRTPTLRNATTVASDATVGSTTAVAGDIQFDLRLPLNFAANVSVVGDFNDWDGSVTPMTRDAASGEWSARVTLLPGRHVYAYLVDGEKWVVDPLAPQIPDAGYGPANAVVVEGEPR